MNSRERLLTALNCEIPDRVPISTYELVGFDPPRGKPTRILFSKRIA